MLGRASADVLEALPVSRITVVNCRFRSNRSGRGSGRNIFGTGSLDHFVGMETWAAVAAPGFADWGAKGWPPLRCGGQVLLLFDSLLAQNKNIENVI